MRTHKTSIAWNSFPEGQEVALTVVYRLIQVVDIDSVTLDEDGRDVELTQEQADQIEREIAAAVLLPPGRVFQP